MSAPTDILSTANPRVKRLVRLRKPRERRREGVLIAEGGREVSRALAAGLTLREVWFCDDLWARRSGETPNLEVEPWSESPVKTGGLGDLVKDGRLCGVGGDEALQIRAATEVFRKVAWHREPEGLLAVFGAPRHGLDTLQIERGRLLVAVGTEKPGNLGAMVRSAAAAGCDGVLVVGPAVDVYNPNVIRNSTGAVFGLPVVGVDRDEDAVHWLRSRGVRIAAALAEGGVSCFAGDLVARPDAGVAVVVGPEHAGLNAAWRDAADLAVTIPTATGGGVDSLNASTAAAVLLFEMVRQSEAV